VLKMDMISSWVTMILLEMANTYRIFLFSATNVGSQS
jgi:hypothetical protein